MVSWLFGPRRGIAASPWRPVGAVFLVLTISVAATALAGAVMAAVIGAGLGWARPSDAQSLTGVLVGLNLAYFFLVVGLVVACWVRRGATLANSLLLRRARWSVGRYALFAVITVLTLVLLQQMLFYLAALFGDQPADPMRDLERLRALFRFDEPTTLIALAVLAVGLAPLAEEFVFRGMLFAAFQKTRLGVVGSAVVLSVVWAVLHWGYSSQSIVALIGLGLLFAYITWHTGSLWPAIVGHAANNLVAVVALMGLQA